MHTGRHSFMFELTLIAAAAAAVDHFVCFVLYPKTGASKPCLMEINTKRVRPSNCGSVFKKKTQETQHV